MTTECRYCTDGCDDCNWTGFAGGRIPTSTREWLEHEHDETISADEVYKEL